MHRLLPDPGQTTVDEQLSAFDPATLAFPDRPFLFSNFAVSVDGRAAIEGVSGAIGSDTDSEMLLGLRTTPDAILVGAGTIRAETYGPMVPAEENRDRRVARGLDPDPLAVVVSGSLDLPWEIGLFTKGLGRVLVVTKTETEADVPDDLATPVDLLRLDEITPAAYLSHLREELGIRSVLCEGGPGLHGGLVESGVVDELFLTFGATFAGGDAPRIAEGLAGADRPLELRWLLAEGSELFARYAFAN